MSIQLTKPPSANSPVLLELTSNSVLVVKTGEASKAVFAKLELLTAPDSGELGLSAMPSAPLKLAMCHVVGIAAPVLGGAVPKIRHTDIADLGLSAEHDALIHAMFHNRSLSDRISFLELWGLEIFESLDAFKAVLEDMKLGHTPLQSAIEKLSSDFMTTYSLMQIGLTYEAEIFVKCPVFSPDPSFLMPLSSALRRLERVREHLHALTSALPVLSPKEAASKSSSTAAKLALKLFAKKIPLLQEIAESLTKKLDLGLHFLKHPQGPLILTDKNLSAFPASKSLMTSDVRKTLKDLFKYLHFYKEVNEAIKHLIGVDLARSITYFGSILEDLSSKPSVKDIIVLKKELSEHMAYCQRFSQSYALRLHDALAGKLTPEELSKVEGEPLSTKKLSQNSLVSQLTSIYTQASITGYVWMDIHRILEQQVLVSMLPEDRYTPSENYLNRLHLNLDLYFRPVAEKGSPSPELSFLLPIKAKIRTTIETLLEGLLESLDKAGLEADFRHLCDHKMRTGLFMPPIWLPFVEKFTPVITHFPLFLKQLTVLHEEHLAFLATHLTFESASTQIPLIQKLYFEESLPLIIWTLIVTDVHALLAEGDPEIVYTGQDLPEACLDFLSIEGIEKSVPPPVAVESELEGSSAPKEECAHPPLAAGPPPKMVVKASPAKASAAASLEKAPFTIARGAKQREIIRLLKEYGFTLDHSTGGHRIFRNSAGKQAILPLGELPAGTARGLEKQVNA